MAPEAKREGKGMESQSALGYRDRFPCYLVLEITTLQPTGFEVLRSSCLFVCLLGVLDYQNHFTKFSVHINCGRGSVASDDNGIGHVRLAFSLSGPLWRVAR